MYTEELGVQERDIVFFDCEFSGLDMIHEIVEIGWVKVRAKTFEVLSEHSIKIRPTRLESANQESLAISGYNLEGWRDAVDLKSALQIFLRETDGVILAGHNVAIDLFFLKKSIEECGLAANYFYKSLDTFSMAWTKLYGDDRFQKFSLSELAPHFGVDMGRHHQALDDARTTYGVFKKLMER